MPFPSIGFQITTETRSPDDLPSNKNKQSILSTSTLDGFVEYASRLIDCTRGSGIREAQSFCPGKRQRDSLTHRSLG
jgi:hypothetical protein